MSTSLQNTSVAVLRAILTVFIPIERLQLLKTTIRLIDGLMVKIDIEVKSSA